MKVSTDDTVNPSITNTAWPQRIVQSIPASYTIWYNSDDAKYYGESNIAGVSDIAANATAHTVINNALSALTAGRTWQEKVLLKGNFTTTSSINVPDYTLLQIDGKINLANSSDTDVIKNENSGDSYITIIGGTINANGNNQTAASTISGIYLNAAQYSEIINVKILNPLRFGIRLEGAHRNCLSRNYVYDSVEHCGIYLGGSSSFNQLSSNYVKNCWGGIALSGSCNENSFSSDIVELSEGVGFSLYNGASMNTFSSCIADSCGQSIPVGESGSGFYLEKLCLENSFSACVSRNNAHDGFNCNGTGGGSNLNSFTGCQAILNTLHGFDINNGSRENQIMGGTAISNERNGIFIYENCHDNSIMGVIVRNNSQELAGSYNGITLSDSGTACTSNIIMGCRCRDNQGAKTQDYGIRELANTDFSIIIGNNLRDNRTASLGVVGANTIFDAATHSDPLNQAP